MAIKKIVTDLPGQVGIVPRTVKIETDDSFAVVTAAGYLDSAKAMGYSFYPTDLFEVTYGTGITQIFTASISGGIITLEPGGSDIILPVVDGNFCVFSGTSGSIDDRGYLPTNAAKTKVVMANAAVIANHIACFTDTSGTVDDDAATAINAGNIQAGLSGTAGTLASYPSTASRGSLKLVGVANTGNTDTIISNAAMGQASTMSIPDPGAATANFLLDTGTANLLTDYQKFIGINEILIASVGTWTRIRIAQGNYVLRHTDADDTSVIGIDITEALRTTASKGLRLASIDVIYSIAALALDAHTLTLDRITYANNVAVSVNSVALTGSLATATQANPYLTNIAVTTPAFLNTADSKYVLELTVDAGATSAYDFYGLVLRFSETIA